MTRRVWQGEVGSAFIELLFEALATVDIHAYAARHHPGGRFFLPAVALCWEGESAWFLLPSDQPYGESEHESSGRREVANILGTMAAVLQSEEGSEWPLLRQSAWDESLGALQLELIASRSREQDLDAELEALKREMGLSFVEA
jgi:hypothetical protein